MPTINFFIQSKNNPAGIYVRLRDGRAIDAKAKTNYAINPDDWSEAKGKPKNLKSEDLKELNANLEDFSNRLLKYYNSSTEPKTTLWLKSFINPSKQSIAPDSLIRYLDYYLAYRGTELSDVRIKQLNAIRKIFERLESKLKHRILIKEIDLEFKKKLEKYLVEEKYSINQIAKVGKIIKTLCLHARIKGIPTHLELDVFKPKYESVEKIYLTLDELKLVSEVVLDFDYQDNARDWLLISCETGQRVSDFMRFTKEMIRYENGKPLIEFTQVKTKKIMTIPLSKKVIEILKKREGKFPRQISDQKYNDYIKEVCKKAKINQLVKGSRSKTKEKITRKEAGTFKKWQLVTSHIGRRSFATNNYGRIPTSLLIGATGHSTEKMFLEYIGKSDSQKALQLAEYF